MIPQRLDKLQGCSANQQTTKSAFSVIVFPGIVDIITSRRICSNVLKNVSDHHWIRRVLERATVRSWTTENNEIEIPVRPTDDVLLGTKAWTVIISLGWCPCAQFAVVSTSPTSLQHTAFFMFSVSFPTVTFCFRESERKTERSNKLANVRNPFNNLTAIKQYKTNYKRETNVAHMLFIKMHIIMQKKTYVHTLK